MRESGTEIIQDLLNSAFNSTLNNLAAGATFDGSAEETLGYDAIKIVLMCSSDISLLVYQSPDGSNWDVVNTYEVKAGVAFTKTIQTCSAYVKVSATNIGPSASTYLRLKTVLVPVSLPLPRSCTVHDELRTNDCVNSEASDCFLTLSTTPQELKVGTVRNAGRKYVWMQALTSNVKWGFSTDCRFDLFKNQLILQPVGDVPIYVKMSTGSGTVVVAEGG